MSSRKEEERNEKIIRGLMKLPPNRRCINCNSMGPQYVCTNFWTFVCMTCSGIHREFTHRVKSVSMAKFTSQEVEALQKGGNQRAREIYLKHWDPQRHRLPDNSNADRIREFIRSVYLDKKYVGGGSSDRPPKDIQNGRSHDEEIRRASSYHSYSQSPPYDFQYEERRYGKQAPVLTRKPGSDRPFYDGKFSSFLSPSHLSDRSPSRLSDHMYEDHFANERSNSRILDYSASSGGDPFRSNIQSPNSERDIGSPSSETSRDFASDVIDFTGNPNPDSGGRRSFGQMLHPQRTASSGSFGSFDSQSFKSVNSVSLVDATCEDEQPMEAHNYKKSTSPSLPQASISGSSDGLDLFNAPFAPETVASSIPAGSGSQLPGLSSTQLVDLLQPSPPSTAPTFSAHQQPRPISSSSLDMFPMSSQPAASFSDKPLHFKPQNEGWATFETPQHLVQLSAADSTAAEIPASDSNSLGNFNQLSFAQWPSFQDNAHGPSSVMPPMWNAGVQQGETIQSTTTTEPWNAFDDSRGKLGESREQVIVHQSSFPDKYLSTESKDIDKGGIPDFGRESSSSVSNVSFSPNINLSPHDSSVLPAGHFHALERKSTNPFDIPYDAEINCENMSQFLEMSALQTALPSFQAPSPFAADATDHWFAHDPIAPYVHSGSEGAFGFIAGHAQSSQISTVSSQGPVASSVGGNPFA